MYPIPSTEKLVETKVCRHCQTSFPITDKDLEFYDKVSPTFGGKKYSIPAPTLCPDCRQQRRLSFRNERKLYKRKCDATGKDIISIYSPDKPYKVYHQDIWWSDNWDPMSYGRDFDFERGFFEQLRELWGNVPLPNVYQTACENSDYTNHSYGNKNCYMISGALENQGLFYSSECGNCEDCMDIYISFRSQNCYQCINIKSSSNLYHSINTQNSRNAWFLYNCQWCSDCFMCENLINKSYCIRNKQFTKEEYEKEVLKLREIKTVELLDEFSKRRRECIHTHLTQVSSENSLGDELYNCKDCKNCFTLFDGRNAAYIWSDGYSVDTYDCYGTSSCPNSLEWLSFLNGHNKAFGVMCIDGDNLYCSILCYSSSHLFWCIGLRNKSYCILNKQYTKEEYETLVPKIIEHMMKTGEWWEFFSSSLSPFWYNETVAQEYYPMTRDQILASPMRGGGTNAESIGGVWLEASAWSPLTPLHKGGESESFLYTLPRHPSDATPSFLKGNIFNWSDYEPPFPKVEKIIPASKLPQDIKDIPDDILNWAIECEVTKKPFRIIKQELEFYRKHNLPIPKRHPDQRHLDRMAQRNPRKLFERLCDGPNCEANHKVKGVILDDSNSDLASPMRGGGTNAESIGGVWLEASAWSPLTPLHKGGEKSESGRRIKMITTYAPERPERVYCEECYNKEVIG